MDKIIASIPARTVKLSGGRVAKYPASSKTFERVNINTWRLLDDEIGNPIYTASDVISAVKIASNWDEIRRRYFPMYGFHA